jgi:hypothetical protein
MLLYNNSSTRTSTSTSSNLLFLPDELTTVSVMLLIKLRILFFWVKTAVQVLPVLLVQVLAVLLTCRKFVSSPVVRQNEVTRTSGSTSGSNNTLEAVIVVTSTPECSGVPILGNTFFSQFSGIREL